MKTIPAFRIVPLLQQRVQHSAIQLHTSQPRQHVSHEIRSFSISEALSGQSDQASHKKGSVEIICIFSTQVQLSKEMQCDIHYVYNYQFFESRE